MNHLLTINDDNWQAYCSFFWDPASNWLVVAFKGTGAVEYADWVTDLTITMVPSSDFIPSSSGNAKAIKGFHDRIYPGLPDVSDLGGTRPWDTIRYALCKVTEIMVKQRAAEGKEGNINVWFTGHSRAFLFSISLLPLSLRFVSFTDVLCFDSVSWLLFG